MTRKDDRLSFVSYPALTAALKDRAEKESERTHYRVTVSDVVRKIV